MAEMSEIAEGFFEACETGQGWSKCEQYCTPDATFSAQAEPLDGVTTLEGYTEWMKGLGPVLPDAAYDLKAWAVDEERGAVVAYAVFSGTHTGEGGPVPATGRRMQTDYVYVMELDGDRIRHMTKIWNSSHALQQLGWT